MKKKKSYSLLFKLFLMCNKQRSIFMKVESIKLWTPHRRAAYASPHNTSPAHDTYLDFGLNYRENLNSICYGCF
jgi:hypothetical protein